MKEAHSSRATEGHKRGYDPVKAYGKHGLAIFRFPVEIGTTSASFPPIDLNPFRGAKFAWLKCQPGRLVVCISSGKQSPPKKDGAVVVLTDSQHWLKVDFSPHAIRRKRMYDNYNAEIKV